jgi:hypothetical protein
VSLPRRVLAGLPLLDRLTWFAAVRLPSPPPPPLLAVPLQPMGAVPWRRSQ